MECRRNGYITGYRNIIATEGNNAEQNLSLTPNIYGAEALRIVLEWGLDPRDLDSHLVGPRPGEEKMFHTWYGQKKAYKDGQMIANLDLDDVTSYGPETTRVYEMAEGTYTFYVHHCGQFQPRLQGRSSWQFLCSRETSPRSGRLRAILIQGTFPSTTHTPRQR